MADQPVGQPVADWPVREALGYAAGVLRAPRALLVWSEAEEPWTWLSLRLGRFLEPVG